MFEREGAKVIRGIDFDRVRNTETIQHGNQVSYAMWEREQEARRLKSRQQELIRMQKEAAAYQRALDYYDRPTWRDWLKAPAKVLRAIKRLWS